MVKRNIQWHTLIMELVYLMAVRKKKVYRRHELLNIDGAEGKDSLIAI